MFEEQYAKINNTCIVIITTILVTVALAYTKTAMVPFTLAIFVYAVAAPAIDFIQTKLRLSRWLAVLIGLSVFLVASGALSFFLFSSIGRFIEGADIYQKKIYELFNLIADIGQSFGFSVDRDAIRDYLRQLPVFDWARDLTGAAVSMIGTTSLVIIFVIFLIAGKGTGDIESPLINEIHTNISRYVSVKILLSLLTGLLIWVLLSVVDAELAFLFGVLTVILNFIPSIGSIIAVILPLPILYLQFGFGAVFFVVLSCMAVTQFMIGNVLEPKMMGVRMDLHPIAVLLFLIFWGVVWGVPGMFLAVPITAVMKIIFSKIETTKAFSELLAGRILKK